MNPIVYGTLNLLLYFMVAVAVVFSGRALFSIPDEIFRKILHFVLLGSFFVLLVSYPTWQSTALAAIIFAIVVYPILFFAERLKKYSEFTTERKSGELKQSLLLVYSMFAVVVTVCCGIFDDKFLALASFYAWGIGDAVAALIGTKYGKHKISLPGLDGKKSYEGSFSMFFSSFVTVLIILSLRGGMELISLIITAFAVGFVSAVSELYSKNGNDTVICPLSAMLTLLPLVYLFGGI
ncbi:MAG: phosphatidate cytidylyltransferase [Oscillospiraceae bacterium]|nr:phosphatidate cytidylyltransferase [Oscillospiraceae bacterium]